MKRFVLILKICVLLVILMALILVGCGKQYVNHVLVSKSTAMVGEKVGLSIKSEDFGFSGCSIQGKDVEYPGSEYQWSVAPSSGATVEGGVFIASEPGTYIVSPENGPAMGEDSNNVPVTIVVRGTAAETGAADTTATKATTATTAKTAETTAAATTTEPSEITTETEETSTETDAASTEIDPNLIHGVVPTKVTAHGTATNNTGTWDLYFEFWNVGKPSGEQYAKATLTEVCTKPAEGMGVKQNATIVFDGYFTGGPNGDMYLTYTYSVQLRSDSPETTMYTTDSHCKVKDGKKIVFDEGTDASSVPIDNPEAFDGWID